MGLTIERPPEYHSHARPELVQYVPESACTILDLGCGDGSTLALLAERGHPPELLAGIETDSIAIATAFHERPKINIQNADLWEMCVRNEVKDMAKFDCIIMGDILEHMPYPVPFVSAWADRLISNGTLVMSVPNMGWIRVVNKILNQSFGYQTAGHFDADHKRFFCKEDIRLLVEHCGLTIEKLQPLSADSDICNHEPHTPLEYNNFVIPDPSADLIEQLSCYQWLCVARKGDSNGKG